MSYDSRLAFDPSLERAGAIEGLIEREPELFSLQRSIEIAEGRVMALARALAICPQGFRHHRIEGILGWARRVAAHRKRALQWTLEEWGDDE